MQSLPRLRHVFALLTLALLFWAGGCVRTTQPILLDEQVISDPDIIGNWTTNEGKDQIKVSKGDKDKEYAVVYTDEKNKQGKFICRLGKIDAMEIAEIKPVDSAPDANDAYRSQILPLYTFLFIEKTAADKVKVNSLDPKWLGKYLEAHPDELKVADVGSTTDKVITSSTQDIQTFIRHHAKDEGAQGDNQELHKTPEKK